MGGEGSGRKPDVVKHFFEKPKEQPVGTSIYIPNYSGIKQGLTKSDDRITYLTTISGSNIQATNLSGANLHLLNTTAGARIVRLERNSSNVLDIITPSGSPVVAEFKAGSASSPTSAFKVVTAASGEFAIGDIIFSQDIFTNKILLGKLTEDYTGAYPLEVSGSVIVDNDVYCNAIYNGVIGPRVNNGAIIYKDFSGVEIARYDTQNKRFGVGAAAPTELMHISGGSLAISNAAAPTATAGMGKIFVSGGALYFIGSSGTTTRLAVA